MLHEDFVFYSSEVATLKALLERIPIENVLDRAGLEARLEEVEQHLANFKHFEKKANKKFWLTFQGEPVWGSQGFLADFGPKAVDIFISAVQMVAAALEDTLGKFGPIPDKQKNKILIVGLARGSFGFEMEIPPVEDDQTSLFDDEPTEVEKSVDIVVDLFEQSAKGSDEEIAGILETIPRRAVKAVSDFLEYTLKHGATCNVAVAGTAGKRQFRYQDTTEVQTSVDRLSEQHIHEKSVTFPGEFIGILPLTKTFEFKADSDVIKGKIRLCQEEVNRLSRDYTYKQLNVSFEQLTVGDAKPKYVLSTFPS